MAADDPIGDAAGLIGYHRSPHGMVHDDELAAIVKRWNVRYLGEVRFDDPPSGVHTYELIECPQPQPRQPAANWPLIASITFTTLWITALILYIAGVLQ